MRWINHKPELGAQRYKVKFAFWPKRVGKETIVWLERYISVQSFKQVHYFCRYGRTGTEYIENEWVEVRTSIWAGNDHTIITNL